MLAQRFSLWFRHTLIKHRLISRSYSTSRLVPADGLHSCSTERRGGEHWDCTAMKESNASVSKLSGSGTALQSHFLCCSGHVDVWRPSWLTSSICIFRFCPRDPAYECINKLINKKSPTTV